MNDETKEAKRSVAIDLFSFHLKVCSECGRKDCKAALFGCPPPEDCPYQLEHLLGDQDDDEIE